MCNHCGVTAAWSRKTLKMFWKIYAFFSVKRFLTVKFSKFCSESFHRDTDRCVVFKFREIWPTGNRWNRALLTLPDKNKNKISPGTPAVATGRIESKIFQGQPPTVYSRVLQISSKFVHIWQSYSRTRELHHNVP